MGAESPTVDGAALLEFRQRHGLSQAALAAELHTTAGSICQWEKGQCRVPGFLPMVLRWLEMILNRRADQTQRRRADREFEATRGVPAYPRRFLI